MRPALLLLAAALAPCAAQAGMFESREARAALGEELRELFHASPDLVASAVDLPVPMANEIASELYAEDIAEDLGRIAREASSLFDRDRPAIGDTAAPVVMALLVGDDCPACDTARAELADLADRLGARVNVIDVAASPADRAIMERLTLDALPSYVMQDKMIRGQMPAIALERYLSE